MRHGMAICVVGTVLLMLVNGCTVPQENAKKNAPEVQAADRVCPHRAGTHAEDKRGAGADGPVQKEQGQGGGRTDARSLERVGADRQGKGELYLSS